MGEFDTHIRTLLYYFERLLKEYEPGKGHLLFSPNNAYVLDRENEDGVSSNRQYKDASWSAGRTQFTLFSLIDVTFFQPDRADRRRM